MAKADAMRLHTWLLFGSLAWAHAGDLLLTAQPTGQDQQLGANKPKTRLLRWEPPHVDSRLHSLIPTPPCVLPGVLEQAGSRANALFDGLKSFTAREDIAYEKLESYPVDDFHRTYDYRVLFRPGSSGLVLQDSRDFRGRSKVSVAFEQDLGLPELALILLPGMQADYDFKCEGTTLWKGQPAFVLSFKQRKDKPRRTVSFRGEHAAFPASIRGRVWIGTDSGEVQHMETSLMDPIPEVGVRNWYLSIDYGAIAFPARNVRMILPQTVDAYCEFRNWVTIAYHTFTDFKLFGVEVTLKPATSETQ
jgi:hypothetical protein